MKAGLVGTRRAVSAEWHRNYLIYGNLSVQTRHAAFLLCRGYDGAFYDPFAASSPRVTKPVEAGVWLLPSDHLIDNFLLFGRASSEVYSGGFDAFMSHQVSQKRYVIEFFEEIFGKPMPERVRIDY